MALTNRSYDLVAAGHLCLDIIPDFPDTGARHVDDLLAPGKLINVGPCALSTGGSVSNTGIAAAKLGCRVAYMAKVGRDAFGDIVCQFLQRYGSSDRIARVEDAATSYSVTLAIPGIDRMFIHCTGANDTFASESVAFDLVSDAGIFHLGYPTLLKRLYENNGHETIETLRKAKNAGATTSLDTSLPEPQSPAGQADWPRIFRGALPHVDLFLPSAEEALLLIDREQYLKVRKSFSGDVIDHITTDQLDRMATQFVDMGAAIVALKCGHRGFFVKTGSVDRLNRMGVVKTNDANQWAGRQVWKPAYRADRVASAAGAGDASIAGFLTAFLRGLGLEDCLRAANCVGLQNLRELDTLSGIADWETTRAMINDPPPISDANVTGERWRFDKAQTIWRGPDDPA